LSRPIKHLTVSAVKAIHAEVLAAHGGAHGIRYQALLESAVAAPQASMMGQPLISNPVEIAAAYLFYVCRKSPLHRRKQTDRACCLFGFPPGQ
jgi:death-on-curing protein